MAGLIYQLSRQVLALVANTRLNGFRLHTAFGNLNLYYIATIG
jgi:hypothetical protein